MKKANVAADAKDACPACPVNATVAKFSGVVERVLAFSDQYLSHLALLWARYYIGSVFFKSGLTKIGNLQNAAQLFEWEYIPNWEKNAKNVLNTGLDLSWTVPSPQLGATLSTYAELAFPVLLVLGLGGRLGALGLLGMAVTIEVFVYPGNAQHYGWMTILLLLLAMGPGKISVDYFLRQKVFGCRKP